MTRKIFCLLVLIAALTACGRPEKPVAKVAGKWISFEQWQTFVKTHYMSQETDKDKLKAGLDQLVRREVACERGKRKGLYSGADWEEVSKRIERDVLVKNFISERYLQGRTAPGEEEISSVLRVDKSRRHILGVGVRDHGAASEVAEELRKGGDIRAIFEKHKGEMKNGPNGFDLGLANLGQLPQEIQKQFFSAKPGTVLDPVRYGEEGYIVPVLQELVEPDPALKNDPSVIKKAELLMFQRAIKKADDDLKAKYPEAFDNVLVSSLLKNERPTEEELNSKIGTIGGEKITFAQLMEVYFKEAQRSGPSAAPASVEVLHGIFNMLASERRISSAARDEGYLKKEPVKLQLWDFSQEARAKLFIQDYLKNFVAKEETLKEYFKARESSFQRPARFRVRYLIGAEAASVKGALVAMKNGAPWESALKAPGILPADTGNGDMGWKTEQELADIFNGLNLPSLTGNLIQSPKGGWGVVQVGQGKWGAFQLFDREDGIAADFDKARDDVSRMYMKENGQKLLQDYLDDEGRKGIKIETFPQNLL